MAISPWDLIVREGDAVSAAADATMPGVENEGVASGGWGRGKAADSGDEVGGASES